MTKNVYIRFLVTPASLLLILALAMLACGPLGGAYEETFDSVGNWGSGSDIDVEGNVNDGRFELFVKAELGLYWSTAGEDFGDGIYEIEATQLEGPLDNGYGMMFRINNDTDSFYLFEVSGDGFIWIGRCDGGCEDDVTVIVSDSWFESPAVNQGLNTTNRLRVQAEGPNLIFYVNDQEVGRVTDESFVTGDIGILVETLGEGGVRVAFDNFTISPIEQE